MKINIFAVALFLILVNKIECGTKKKLKIDAKWFPLNIIHLNDFHAKFEETSVDSGLCKEGQKCIGGYARVVTMVKQLKKENKHLNPIYLNAGDNFKGSLWYTLFRWNVTQHFLNLLPADAMTIGNHEFRHGIAGAVPFLETIKSPIVITNVNDSLVPSFQNKYTKSTIIERNGRKIGIIGVILETTNVIVRTGDLTFTRESDAVKEEAKKLKNQGVNIIIVLSHCGIDVDKKIALYGGTDIDIIVGGHSHTFLFTGPNPPGPDRPKDSYPVVVTQKSQHKVLIVQASAFTKYLGNIILFFDDAGKVQHFKGDPIFLGPDVVPDPMILEEMKPWKAQVDLLGRRKVGETTVELSNAGCYIKECSMGSFVTDAYVNAYIRDQNIPDKWAVIALANPSDIRTTIKPGKISYNDLFTTLPFDNILGYFQLKGKHLRQALEESAIKPSFLQVSGIKVTYNLSRPKYKRVVDLQILCRTCDIPEYRDVENEKWYRIAMVTYLTKNRNWFPMIHDNMRNHKIGSVDIDALTSYVKFKSPIGVNDHKNRITVVK